MQNMGPLALDSVQNTRLLALSSVQHFLVDGVCICCMFLLVGLYYDRFGAAGYPHAACIAMSAVLTYNVLAFMSQPLTGLLADRLKACHWLLIASMLLLTLAVALASLISMLAAGRQGMTAEVGWQLLLFATAVSAGLGNSLFHVWGGKQTVVSTGNDPRALGVFVSTGALGLAVGFVWCSWLLLYVLLLAFVATSIAYVYTSVFKGTGIREGDGTKSHSSPRVFSHSRTITLLMAIMLFVAYRSFAGEVFSHGITKTQTLVLLIGLISMSGKMAGGWVTVRLGVLLSLALALAGASLCVLLRGNGVAVLLAGIFLMNTTMPMTLFLANDLLPRREGLAFGLLAAALIPGYLLAVYM